jgi:hypothetical protein
MRNGMKRAILAAILLLSVNANASPVTAVLHENQRLYRNTGALTLTDPISGEVLGTYEFGTGGYGNGSAPFGEYVFRDYQGTGPGEDPLHIGERWLISNPGLDPGEADDPGIPGVTKPRKRTGLEIHTGLATNGTLGSLAILGGKEVYARFLQQMKYILRVATEPVSFTVKANPDGTDVRDAIVAYFPPIVKGKFAARSAVRPRARTHSGHTNHAGSRASHYVAKPNERKRA